MAFTLPTTTAINRADSILFLTLDTFSKKGGIQQYNKLLMKALEELCRERKKRLVVMSLYDAMPDERYIAAANFRSYSGSKWKFFTGAFGEMDEASTVFLAHINLWPATLVAKAMGLGCRVIQLTHGVEIWQKLPWYKSRALHSADRVATVSRYTAGRLKQDQHLAADKIFMLPNAPDPFSDKTADHLGLQQRLRIHWDGPILLTVCRLAPTEYHKGFFEVIDIMPALIKQFHTLRYIIAGKADAGMASIISSRAEGLGLAGRVLLAGELTDSQLNALYQRCDVFVMPSTKEGFGIVYLEAALHGLPVVAADAGGAPEALLEGKLGKLVPPGNTDALKAAVSQALESAIQGGDDGKQLRKTANAAAVGTIFDFIHLKNKLRSVIAIP